MKPLFGTRLNHLHPINRGLVGFWLFNERAGTRINDISGGNNHGTAINFAMQGSTSNWSGSPSGASLLFDGVDDHIAIPNSRDLNVNVDLTMVCRIRRKTVGTQVDIYKAGTNTNFWSVSLMASNQINFSKQLISDNLSTGTITDTNWHQIAVVKKLNSGNNLTFYIDGKNAGTAAVANVQSPSGLKQIGLITSSMDGEIDYVMLYNRDLTASEVQQLYLDPFIGCSKN